MSKSTKPYLVRALHQWCTDQDYVPYIRVWVNEYADVPGEYVENNEIVLNISYNATRELTIHNDFISFDARFGGVSRKIWLPMGNVISIFSRETGEGMEFDVELTEAKHFPRPVVVVPEVTEDTEVAPTQPDDPNGKPRPSGRPSLRIVK